MQSGPHRGSSPSFEAQWRERFEEFAEVHEDDAGIAGWSPSGLDTRFRFFRSLWDARNAGSRWLDVGCGAGTYSRWLAAQKLDVVGLDYSQPTLRKARTRLPATIALCAGDATRLPFANDTFDGVLCFGVLQAVSDTSVIVTELARVLRPAGEIWVDALNRDGLAARWTELRRRIRHRPQHLRYESATVLEDRLLDAGFVEVSRRWLPMAPARFARLQAILESRSAMVVFEKSPQVGALFSHSIVCQARKAPN